MSTVSLWSIAKHTALYKADDLSGEGAKLMGGRWNSKSVPVIYAACTITLAVLHVSTATSPHATVFN